MKKSKIALTTALALSPLATAVALSGCSQVSKVYHILNINDLHGAVPGYGEDVSVVDPANPGCFRIYKEIKKITDKYPGSVFLSAGDENSGDSWSTFSHGQTTYPILKAMGCRYCAVGNHAFEWGLTDMSNGTYDRIGRTDETEGKYFVTSNVLKVHGYSAGDYTWEVDPSKPQFATDFKLWNDLRVSWADPYKVLTFGKAKVCLIGLTTTQTLTDGNGEVTKDLSFADYKACVHYTKHLAKQELGADAYNAIDSFILFTHCAAGKNKDTGAIEGEAADLAQTINTDIDAVISAHSHKVYCGQLENKTLNKKIWIAQAGTAGRYLTDTKLVFDQKAKPGKRLKSISMAVNPIAVPKNEKEAIQEWKDYCSSGSKLAEIFNYERDWTRSFFSQHLSQANLTEKEKQPEALTNKFDGYYNGIRYAKDIHGEAVVPGHAYYNNDKNVIDHFGGWYNRGLLIGFYTQYYQYIMKEYTQMPCVSFTTQDTIPSKLKNGEVTVREVYDMIPYDNFVSFFYLNIFQLANIINYSLAGQPDAAEKQGFLYGNFEKAHRYQPDLNWYCGTASEKDKPIQVGLNKTIVKEGQKRISSCYLCGPMSMGGVQVELTNITDEDRKITIKDAGVDIPVYDPTAKLRVATDADSGGSGQTTPVEIDGVTYNVYLPRIKVFKYKVLTQTPYTDNLSELDTPGLEGSWADASEWAKSVGGKLPLIPCVTNSFMFEGGNDGRGGNQQTRAFKEYSQYNIQNQGIEYSNYNTTLTARQLLELFLSTSLPEGRDWSTIGTQSVAPTNVSWKVIEKLIKKI